ncbi:MULTISPECIES: hypothetical protein [unclassified Kribbella]|uniref:hypothetical protein n=1 Tax=unclassified Kribbella TaxID=2644121 RepID=UPI00301775E6
MDARVKTFVGEARERFGFLLDAGFSEPTLDGPGGHPVVLTLTYVRADARVDVSLVLAYMGEEDVSSTLRTTTGHILRPVRQRPTRRTRCDAHWTTKQPPYGRRWSPKTRDTRGLSRKVGVD